MADDTTRLQHQFEDLIMTTLHNHLGEMCMEVILTKGGAKRVKELVENLKAITGMESVKMNMIRLP